MRRGAGMDKGTGPNSGSRKGRTRDRSELGFELGGRGGKVESTGQKAARSASAFIGALTTAGTPFFPEREWEEGRDRDELHLLLPRDGEGKLL